MTSKTLQYVLYQRKVTFGKHRGKSMQVARLTGRYQVDFERFCSLVARNTTLN
ncbi:MAG: histidinol phosphate phosphatase, partial [Porphyromonadaceae bacterium]|nr:histidinol phosphate phosphatase [Porphyromonadaceae bacterium]